MYVHTELTERAETAPVLPGGFTLLIGTTQDFLFLYRVDTQQSHVVPRGSVWQLRICDASRPAWHFFVLQWPVTAIVQKRPARPCAP